MVKLLFTKTRTMESAAVRFVTWSQYSHVDLVTRSGLAVGAVLGQGVVQVPLDVRLAKASRYAFAYVVADSYAVEAFVDQQLGKPYDLTALIGMMARRDWQKDDRWFCSELVAAALKRTGSAIVCKDTGRVTPQDLLESPLLTLAETGEAR